MNTSADAPWSQPDQHLDPMAQMTTGDLDDLANLFEFGDIDLNVNGSQYGGSGQPSGNLSHPGTPFDDMNALALPPGTTAQDFGGIGQYGMQQDMAQQQQFMPQAAQVPISNPYTTEAMYQPSIQQAYHQQIQPYPYQQQHGFPPGQQVPPTPNSFDMHGDVGRFMQQHQQIDPQQRAILEQRYGLRKDDATVFTPMVSPAGTPQYNVQPEFTVPGAYFSPLTSPMLHAQLSQNAQQGQHLAQPGYYTNPSTAPSSNATSPMDLGIDVDTLGDSMALPEPAAPQSKKPRRKVATPRSVGMSSRIRQSPIQKAQKRKSGSMLSNIVPPKDVNGLIPEAQKSGSLAPGSAGLQLPCGFNGSSEGGSISPEPLSESVMGPPPRPGSALYQSPAIAAQHQDDKTSAVGAAATPNSLLSGRANQQAIDGAAQCEQGGGEMGQLDDLQLPAAASQQVSRRPSLTRIDTQLPAPSSTEQTPRLSARKTPKLGPLSTPASARPASALASPSAIASPMSATTPGALLKDKKLDVKGGKGSNKRGSVGASTSALTSPALRPRISPSIKPLLPEGSPLHTSTHALLLASKSNYQNLLEGNHLPGVSYPDSLSTGLTSKRTSHKFAEQGRRNRINDALKEMQSLLPREYVLGKAKRDGTSEDSPEAGGPDGDGKGGAEEEKSAKSNNSKAATVESANVYIRNTQKKQLEMEVENEQLRRKLEEMERRLTEQSGATSSTEKAGSGSGSGSGSAVDSASPASAKVK